MAGQLEAADYERYSWAVDGHLPAIEQSQDKAAAVPVPSIFFQTSVWDFFVHFAATSAKLPRIRY